ncbi:hypothetical protein SB775_29635, partial [Peribacillus sp. SIMBA_075]|uniref:hypothetical protein n=1 Tax=Peribacillus sp. SIMBA_075 TaxID=3085813 RepID=UPI00397B44F7
SEVDGNTYKSLLAIDKIKDNEKEVNGNLVSKLYEIPEHKVTISIIYSREKLGTYKGSRLLYISGKTFFDIAIHGERHIVIDIPIYKTWAA